MGKGSFEDVRIAGYGWEHRWEHWWNSIFAKAEHGSIFSGQCTESLATILSIPRNAIGTYDWQLRVSILAKFRQLENTEHYCKKGISYQSQQPACTAVESYGTICGWLLKLLLNSAQMMRRNFMSLYYLLLTSQSLMPCSKSHTKWWKRGKKESRNIHIHQQNQGSHA